MIQNTDLFYFTLRRREEKITMKIFKHPFTAIISGPSGSGKTCFVEKLLKHANKMIQPIPDRIIWHYGTWQSMYESMKGVEFKQGPPTEEDIQTYCNSLLIIDDLMSECVTLSSNIFTKFSHHLKISVIYILQNLFVQSKNQRSISLNTGHIILFKNPRDFSQVMFLARQVAPYNPNICVEAYQDATKHPHSYLLFDFVQDTPETHRMRTNIFPGETDDIYVRKEVDI